MTSYTKDIFIGVFEHVCKYQINMQPDGARVKAKKTERRRAGLTSYQFLASSSHFPVVRITQSRH